MIIPTKTRKSSMQQESENHEDLERVVDKLPMPGGQISFSGMICQPKDGELQEHKGSKQAGQAYISCYRAWYRARVSSVREMM